MSHYRGESTTTIDHQNDTPTTAQVNSDNDELITVPVISLRMLMTSKVNSYKVTYMLRVCVCYFLLVVSFFNFSTIVIIVIAHGVQRCYNEHTINNRKPV